MLVFFTNVLLAISGSTTPVATPAKTDSSLPAARTVTLDTVLVTGTLPGPGLWKVSKGDHVMWVLGTLAPLPKDMKWKSGELESTVAASSEVLVLGIASAKIGVGTFFKMVSLAPAASRTQSNPGGAKLKDVLPLDVYARWGVLKAKYIGRDDKIETLRPMAASQELYWRAIAVSGMSRVNIAWPVIASAAERNGVKLTDTGISYPLDIDRKRFKSGIHAFADSSGADIDCFTRTIDRLELDLEAMKVRANAWATGDMRLMRELTQDDFQPACRAVEDEAMNFQRKPEIAEQLAIKWLTSAERALANNQTSFAVLPVSEIFAPNGRLERLRAKGYLIQAPDEDELPE